MTVVLQLDLNPTIFDVSFTTLKKEVGIHLSLDLVEVWLLQHPWSTSGVHFWEEPNLS